MGRVKVERPCGGDLAELLLGLKDSAWVRGEDYNLDSAIGFHLPNKDCVAVILIKTAYHNCGLFLYQQGKLETIWASTTASHSVADSSIGGVDIRIVCPPGGTMSREYQTYGYTII